jgi:hypothetical protein
VDCDSQTVVTCNVSGEVVQALCQVREAIDWRRGKRDSFIWAPTADRKSRRPQRRVPFPIVDCRLS